MLLISRKLCRLLLVFDLLYFTQDLTSFSSIDHLIRCYARFLILFRPTWMRLSRSTHLLMSLFLGTFDVDHKDWLTYSGGTDRPGEFSYNFSILNDLTQIVNFPTRIPDCDSHSPVFLNLFISSDASICSAMAFRPLGNSDHSVVSVSINFPIKSNQEAPFHCVAYYYSGADWDGFHDHLRDVPWEDIFKLSASAPASEFCGWAQIGIDVYIPHCKYQVKPYSSPLFSAACAAAIVHRNHFFRQYQQNNSKSKVKFRQTSNGCKSVLEAVKLAYATKTKKFHQFPET